MSFNYGTTLSSVSIIINVLNVYYCFITSRIACKDTQGYMKITSICVQGNM